MSTRLSTATAEAPGRSSTGASAAPGPARAPRAPGRGDHEQEARRSTPARRRRGSAAAGRAPPPCPAGARSSHRCTPYAGPHHQRPAQRRPRCPPSDSGRSSGSRRSSRSSTRHQPGEHRRRQAEPARPAAPAAPSRTASASGLVRGRATAAAEQAGGDQHPHEQQAGGADPAARRAVRPAELHLRGDRRRRCPGTYLPSWPRKKTCSAARSDSGVPRSASSARHTSALASRPTSTATRLPAAPPRPMRPQGVRAPAAPWPRRASTSSDQDGDQRGPTRTAAGRARGGRTPGTLASPP